MVKYKGIEFESELAARWAVFFEEGGVWWKYKPETIFMEDGTSFTPDFLIEEFRVKDFVIVLPPKPLGCAEYEPLMEKIERYQKDLKTVVHCAYHPDVYIFGEIPKGESIWRLLENHFSYASLHPDFFSTRHRHYRLFDRTTNEEQLLEDIDFLWKKGRFFLPVIKKDDPYEESWGRKDFKVYKFFCNFRTTNSKGFNAEKTFNAYVKASTYKFEEE